MNIIDLFKAWGMYDNAPHLKEFYIAFLPDKYPSNPKYIFCKYINGKIFGNWFNIVKDQKCIQEGILFYVDIDNEKHMDAEQKIRRKKDQFFFNNYWPKPGETGDIDLYETIRVNIIRPVITSSI